MYSRGLKALTSSAFGDGRRRCLLGMGEGLLCLEPHLEKEPV